MAGALSRHSPTVGFVPSPVTSQGSSAQLQYISTNSALDEQEASNNVSNDSCSTTIGIGVCTVLALFFIGFVAMEYCVLK